MFYLPGACALFPLKFATWNSASLLGGLRTTPNRWGAKRKALASLLRSCDIACPRGSRHTAVDLHFLPDSHAYHHTFVPVAPEGLSSRGGGVIIAIRRTCIAQLDPVSSTVIRRGRGLALRLLRGRLALHVISVHMDPALTPRARYACLREVRSYMDGYTGEAFLCGGDWIFAHQDETRLRHGGEEVRAARAESDPFNSMFEDLGELYQPLTTFARGVEGPQSRIDRWYTNISELELSNWLITPSVRGSLQERSPATQLS